MVFVMTSATTPNSEGHGDPPKGCLRDNNKYHVPCSCTHTADLRDVIESR